MSFLGEINQIIVKAPLEYALPLNKPHPKGKNFEDLRYVCEIPFCPCNTAVLRKSQENFSKG